MVIDELISRNRTTDVSKSSFEGELFKSSSHYFLKPLTYMNLSGQSIVAVKNFFKIDEVIVIHDDLDLPFGTLRFKMGGGHGGHNGLKSADAHISREYIRVRMGIGKPEHKGEVSSYVLGNFSEKESLHVKKWVSDCADACEALANESWQDVATKFSVKKFQLQ